MRPFSTELAAGREIVRDPPLASTRKQSGAAVESTTRFEETASVGKARGPGAPAGPGEPAGPVGPAAPAGPVAPVAPGAPLQARVVSVALTNIDPPYIQALPTSSGKLITDTPAAPAG